MVFDPGRDRRAEQRARDAAAVVRQRRGMGHVPRPRLHQGVGIPDGGPLDGQRAPAAPRTRYLIYPHRPIVAYLAQTHRLLSEYCVAFPDETRPYGSARLPDSDDVLAKWMALTGDERRLISTANMHLPGRQLDPSQVSATCGAWPSGSGRGCATWPTASRGYPGRTARLTAARARIGARYSPEP